MRIDQQIALISGANRGLGAAFLEALLQAGARKVYAAVRNPAQLSVIDGRVVPLQLDMKSARTIIRAANVAADVTLLFNNAGVVHRRPAGNGSGSLYQDELSAAREEIEVNYFGLARMARAFAPVLARNGGGAMVNVLSVLAHAPLGPVATYSASKAAAYSLTRSLRQELAAQKTRVVAVLPGFIATDMPAGLDVPKALPADVVAEVIGALASGVDDVYPDPVARGWLQQHIDRMRA